MCKISRLCWYVCSGFSCKLHLFLRFCSRMHNSFGVRTSLAPTLYTNSSLCFRILPTPSASSSSPSKPPSNSPGKSKTGGNVSLTMYADLDFLRPVILTKLQEHSFSVYDTYCTNCQNAVSTAISEEPALSVGPLIGHRSLRSCSCAGACPCHKSEGTASLPD